MSLCWPRVQVGLLIAGKSFGGDFISAIPTLALLSFSRQIKVKDWLCFTFIPSTSVYLNVIRGKALSDTVLLLEGAANVGFWQARLLRLSGQTAGAVGEYFSTTDDRYQEI